MMLYLTPCFLSRKYIHGEINPYCPDKKLVIRKYYVFRFLVFQLAFLDIYVETRNTFDTEKCYGVEHLTPALRAYGNVRDSELFLGTDVLWFSGFFNVHISLPVGIKK